MNSHGQQIEIDGVQYATPEVFYLLPSGKLFGYFYASETGDQYDSELYWGQYGQEEAEAIADAGVEVVIEEPFQDGLVRQEPTLFVGPRRL